MRAKAGFAERTHQIFKSLVAEKVKSLVGSLDADLLLLALPPRAGRRFGDVPFGLELFDEAVDKGLKLLLGEFLNLLERREFAAQQGPAHRLPERFERILIKRKLAVGVLETALQKEVGERFHEVFGGEAEVLFGKLRVTYGPHKSVELLPFLVARRRILLRFAASGAPFLAHEAELLAAANAPVGVEPFEDEFGRRGAHGIALAYPDA